MIMRSIYFLLSLATVLLLHDGARCLDAVRLAIENPPPHLVFSGEVRVRLCEKLEVTKVVHRLLQSYYALVPRVAGRCLL